MESHDTVDTTNLDDIAFDFIVFPGWYDGLKLTFSASNDVCLNVTGSNNGTVRVGQSLESITGAFDLATGGLCGSTPPPGPGPAIACGPPTFDPATEAGFFVWQDCASDEWIAHATGGGAQGAGSNYEGTITSDQPAVFEPYQLSSADRFDVLSDRELSFLIRVWVDGINGIEMNLADNAQTCLDVTGLNGQGVFVGPNKLPLAPPFVLNADSMGACGQTPPPNPDYDAIVCGRPTFDSSIQKGPWLYKDCGATTPTWHLITGAGGDYTQLDGSITSTKAISEFNRISISPTNDNIEELSDKLIGFNIRTWTNGYDEFQVVFQNDSMPCLDVYGVDPADLKLGANQMPAGSRPLNLENLDACRPEPADDALSFLVLLTDDQRFDTTWVMKELQNKLQSRAVEFENALITTPLCCPARASILSGGFHPYNTGILQVHGDNGGDINFHGAQDRDTLATALQNIGYKTAYTGGKYLNGYVAGYIPPGWDMFVNNDKGATSSSATWFDFNVTEGSAGHTWARGVTKPVSQYVANYHRDRILGFMDDLEDDEPFLAFYSVFAPHAPSIPHPDDTVPGITIDGVDLDTYVYRDRAFGEADLSDKPDWVSNPYRFKSAKNSGAPDDDEFHRDNLRSLLSVDRAIGAIIDKLESQNRLDKTVIVFLSDNGFLWGEHGLHQKGMAYEESVKVPFMMYVPGINPRIESAVISANLDLGATIFDYAGISKLSEGMSLKPLLENTTTPWRNELQLQGWGPHEGANGTWAGLRTPEWKYIENAYGEKELYDLIFDEYEMESKHDDPAYSQTLQDFSTLVENARGLSPTIFYLPDGSQSTPYSVEITAWGGTEPYSWAVAAGELPPGLSLNSQTGLISGTPTSTGTFKFRIYLEDSSVRPKTGDPQSYLAPGVPRDNFYSIVIE